MISSILSVFLLLSSVSLKLSGDTFFPPCSDTRCCLTCNALLYAALSLSGRKGHSSTSTVYWLWLLLSCRWFLIITLCHTPNLAFLIVVFIIRIYFGLAYPRRSLELYGTIGSQIFDSSLGPLWSHILGIMLLLVFFIIL